MRKENGKFLVKSGVGVAHDSGTGRTTRATPLEFCFGKLALGWHGHANAATSSANLLVT